MERRLTLTLLAAACTGGCLSLGFEAEVLDRHPFTPPESYSEWWQATEECSQRTGDLARIDWYLASGITGDQVVARGRWSPPHDIIIVRGYEDDPRTVRHEMLHDLLAGDRNHGDPVWTACDLHAS